MLWLSRRNNQTIRIGSDIEVTIGRVRGRNVAVGIKAPRDMRVLRGEIKPHDTDNAATPVQGAAA